MGLEPVAHGWHAARFLIEVALQVVEKSGLYGRNGFRGEQAGFFDIGADFAGLGWRTNAFGRFAPQAFGCSEFGCCCCFDQHNEFEVIVWQVVDLVRTAGGAKEAAALAWKWEVASKDAFTAIVTCPLPFNQGKPVLESGV